MTEEDRRHGLPTRSADWRDPEIRKKLPVEIHPLLDQIADALDEIERRSGEDRREASRQLDLLS